MSFWGAPGDTQYSWGSPTGTQIYPVFYVPGIEPIIMGTVDTITYSTHRDKKQVRPLGITGPRGMARGPRTIAGSMIFKVFGGFEIRDILGYLKSKYRHLLADELPKFSVIILIPPTDHSGEFLENPGKTEIGMNVIALVDCEIVDQAFSLSIDDQAVEQQISYLARDIIDLSHINELMAIMPEIEDGEEAVDEDAGVFRNPLDAISTSGQELLDTARDTALRGLSNVAQGVFNNALNSFGIDE
jgi:hypothetical protein